METLKITICTRWFSCLFLNSSVMKVRIWGRIHPYLFMLTEVAIIVFHMPHAEGIRFCSDELKNLYWHQRSEQNTWCGCVMCVTFRRPFTFFFRKVFRFCLFVYFLWVLLELFSWFFLHSTVFFSASSFIPVRTWRWRLRPRPPQNTGVWRLQVLSEMSKLRNLLMEHGNKGLFKMTKLFGSMLVWRKEFSFRCEKGGVCLCVCLLTCVLGEFLFCWSVIDLRDNQKRTSKTLLRAAPEGTTEDLGGSCRCGQSHLRVLDFSGGVSDEAVTPSPR